MIYDTVTTSPIYIILSTTIGARNYYLTHVKISTLEINWYLDPGSNGGNTIEY